MFVKINVKMFFCGFELFMSFLQIYFEIMKSTRKTFGVS